MSNIQIWQSNVDLQQIKEIYAKNLTDSEFKTFCQIGIATGLNPFLKEIWAIKYGNAPASIFVARDGYRLSAQRNPNYDYHMSDAVYSNDNFQVIDGEIQHTYNIKDRGQLIGAYCIVKRKSSSKPNYVFVELKEYDKKQSVWVDKPATMIKKVAEAQCLRMAFQELFAGTYSEDEYDPQDAKNSIQVVAKNNITKLITGKAQRIPSFDEIAQKIEYAEKLSDLDVIPELVKNFSDEDKAKLRALYSKKEKFLKRGADGEINNETGEIIDIPEYEKVKTSLMKAKSHDTLDIAADLISSCPLDTQEELKALYNKRKGEIK